MFLGGVVLFDAVRLGFGWGPDGPRSGFFPFWLALIMVVVCVAIIAQAVRKSSGAGQCEYSSRKWCSTAHT